MGRQISFFRNAEFESRLLAEALRIGLHTYVHRPTESLQPQVQHLTALGFAEPAGPSAWVDGEFVEYGYFLQEYSARLWFDPQFPDGSPKSAVICSAYEHLAKFTKRQAVFVRSAGVWVPREFHDEFVRRQAEKERELELLVERNRAFARDVLGAKPSSGRHGT